jgi:hypothetical protein
MMSCSDSEVAVLAELSFVEETETETETVELSMAVDESRDIYSWCRWE